jgi:hypothetical protein
MAQLIPNYTGGVQGANSAVLPDSDLALKTYLGLAEQNYKDDLLAHKKALAEAKKVADATAFDTDKMMDVDVKPTLDQITELKKIAFDHPEQIDDPESDFNKLEKDIKFKINKSKYQQSELKYHKTTGADRYKESPELLFDTLHAFENNPDIEKRELVLPVPPPSFNLFDHNDEIVKGTVSANPDKITSTNDGHGNRIYEIPQEVDKTEIAQKVEMKWLADKNKATRMFNSLPDEEKTKFGNDPHEWYVQAKTASLPIDDASKIQIRAIPHHGSGSSAANKVIPYQIGISATENTGAAKSNSMEEVAHIGGWTIPDKVITISSPETIYNMKTSKLETPAQGYLTGKVIKVTDDYVYVDGNSKGKPQGMIAPANKEGIDKLVKNGDVEKKRFVTMIENTGNNNSRELRFEYNDEIGSKLAETGVKLDESLEPTPQKTESGIKWK